MVLLTGVAVALLRDVAGAVLTGAGGALVDQAPVAVLAGAVGALLGGVAGLSVPSLIAAIPEPDPAPGEPAEAGLDGGLASQQTAPVKEPYRSVARRRGLRPGSVAASAAAAGLMGLALGWTWHLAYLWPLVPVGVALAVVDWRLRLLPTRVIAPTYVVLVPVVVGGALLSGETGDLARAGWGWLVAGGLYFLLWFVYPAGMGYGDVRLSGVVGIALGALGWGPLLLGLWLGFVLGGVVGLVLTRAGVVARGETPFGPFLLAGALLGVLTGGPLGAWLLTGG